MTTEAYLGFPYAEFRMSLALTTAQYDAVSSLSTNLTAATLAGDNVTVGGQTITTKEIAENVKSFAIDRRAGRVSRTSVAHTNVKQVQGRFTWEATMEVYVDKEDTSPYIIENMEGHRLLYVVRPGNQRMCAVVDIAEVSEPAPDENGDLVVRVVLMNSGGSTPNWIST